MRINNTSIIGKFDSWPDPTEPDDTKHRVLVRDIEFRWAWKERTSDAKWRSEQILISAGTRWDGASRPWIVGWLVPRWGLMSPASLAHDICFGRQPVLSTGGRISRKHADLLFLHIMRVLTRERDTLCFLDRWQIYLAEAMYIAVRWFGAPTWNAHDSEFR